MESTEEQNNTKKEKEAQDEALMEQINGIIKSLLSVKG